MKEALAVALAKFQMPYHPSEAVRLEICPVKTGIEDSGLGSGNTWCEVCEPDECDFYGVYVRYKNGEAILLRDLVQPTDIASLLALIGVLGV